MECCRIKFYGTGDLSCGWNLKECENFFQNWDKEIEQPDINTILELFNIKKYFDHDMRLEEWSDEQMLDYDAKIAAIPRILGIFCSSISDCAFEAIYKDAEEDYKEDFWQLICDYRVFERITEETIMNLLSKDSYDVWYILSARSITNHFGKIVANHLVEDSRTAEKLILNFLTAHEHRNDQLFLPLEFTSEMRVKVLTEYVERDDCNISYLQLLESAQDSKELPVSDKLKLCARRKKEKLERELFDGNTHKAHRIEVMIKSIPNGAVEKQLDNDAVIYAYSREWFAENQDYPTLLNNFIYIFEYVDRYFRCNFISLQSEMGVLERHLGLKGKKDYMYGIGFFAKHLTSSLQMNIYKNLLGELNIQLEDIYKWFFENYLNNEFGANGFVYSPPSTGTTYTEKCKLLAISIDGVLKQFRLFCEDGFVDRERLELSSAQTIFSMLPSLMNNKYAYVNSEHLRREMLLLFSDQSMMSYTKKTKSKYKTLPQLLLAKRMKKEDFAEYQKKNLEWLMERGTIDISCDGYLIINQERALVLRDLFHHEVVCPHYFSKELRQIVENFVAENEMKFENTLFSKPEQDYLNFALNKSEFSNGWDLRNKYCHDTYTLDEKQQEQDYIELMKIMVLIIIKINEEFCNRE